MLERLRSIWKRWIWGERLRAVHLHLDNAGKPVVSGIVLGLKKDEMTILSHLDTIDSLGGLTDFSQEDIPTVLVITGKGVITKRIARTRGGEEEQIKQQLAEYGNTPVVHSVSVQENWLYISVFRIELVQTWLTKLAEFNIKPVHLEFGIPVIWESLRFVDEQVPIQTGLFKVEFDEKGIVSYSPDHAPSSSYSLGGDQVKGQQLVPYAGLIGFISSLDQGSEPDSLVQDEWEKTFYGKAVKKMGLAALGTLFVIVMVNMGLFMYFHDRQMALEESMIQYQGKLRELESLNSELQRKNGIAAISGTGTNGRFAYYADQVGGTVASKVSLKRMTINPIQKRKRTTDRMEVRPNILEIEGECGESEDMNNWVTTLRELKSVEGIQITGFAKKDNSGQNLFSVEITMGS